MNHLAHLLLAGPGRDHRLGALLGDHLKGRAVLGELRPELAAGVMLHRRIDRWSDDHPAVRALLAGLEPPWRRYGGVILDVLFDHMLHRHWARMSAMPLEEFAETTHRLLAAHSAEFPPRLRRFCAWSRQVDLWRRFGERAMLEEIFRRLARRHGRSRPLADGLALLDRLDGEIEQAFLELFPELGRRARDFLAGGG